ncbi:MAG: D-alanine--D-alanine ligase [Bacteroidales bacterium]|nr:D-alanine--D-alanine ligase [Bacteroidales bacterium]
MKKNIALLLGGYSAEYEISVKSGKVIAAHLDQDLFNVFPVRITEKSWHYTDPEGNTTEVNRNDFSLVTAAGRISFDAAFIGIHGTPGEDGKLQGYLDMMGIPYNTCGRATSALTFNKFFCNEFAGRMGVNVAKTVYLHKRDVISPDEITAITGLPCFVKPNSNGSSIGITKVKTPEGLIPAIENALKEDDEVLVQEFIPGTEVTCGIFEEKGQLKILPLTAIISHKEWFDYEAKYTDGLADEITPAPIDIHLADTCRETSAMLYRKLNCRGIVRFDYILTPESHTNPGSFYFLEVNTVPGLSEASIVPRQAASVGISLKQLFTKVLTETLENYA